MTAKEIINKAKKLPPAPHAATQLLQILDKPAASNEEVVRIVKCDSVLTAKLLRVCNSSFFSFKEPVSSVEQAVLILGHHEILHLVLMLTLGGAMIVPLPAYAMEANDLWAHSILTANAAELLVASGIERGTDPHVAFTAGLLHDIGKVMMSQALTDQLQADVRLCIEKLNLSRAEAEKEVLGCDHAEVGGALLHLWHLPPVLVEAVANHHHPALDSLPRLSVVTHFANVIAHLASATPGWDGLSIRVDDNAANAIGLTPARMEDLIAKVRELSEREHSMAAVA